MMPRGASVLFLLGAGALLLFVAWRGWRNGELPAGASGFTQAFRPNRQDNPFAFHFFLLLYVGSGVALLAWALLELFGMAPPLKWR
jgi:hypothetical protein